jgi:hypothetical protein
MILILKNKVFYSSNCDEKLCVPPSIGIMSPVMNDASPEHINATVLAIFLETLLCIFDRT